MKLISKIRLLMLISVNSYANDDQALEQELKWLHAEKMGLVIQVVSKQLQNKYNAAAIVNVVTAEEIEQFGGNNLADILNRVTSIYMSGNARNRYSLSMRGDLSGGSEAHTLLLINGRPFRDNGFSGTYTPIFRNFPIHQIQRLEIIRGSGSALYGNNAFSAVINIVTKESDKSFLTFRERMGSYNNTQTEAEFGWKQNDLNVSGAVRYRLSKGWRYVNSFINNDLRLDDNDLSATFTANWQDFSLNTFVSHSHYFNPSASEMFLKNGAPYDYQRFFLDLGHQKKINDQWEIKTNFTYNQLVNTQIVPAFIAFGNPPIISQNPARLNENNLLLEHTHFLNFFDQKLNLLIGSTVEWQTGRIHQVGVQDSIVPDYSHLRSNVYGEMSYQVLDNLKVTLGGQWNYFKHLENSLANLPTIPNSEFSFNSQLNDSHNSKSGFVGKAGLIYDITPNIGLKLLYNQAFRSASAFEMEANAVPIKGQHSLNPERVETADAQIFYHDDDYQAAFTIFHSRQSQFITTDNNFPLRYINSGSAIYQGFELETQATLFNHFHWQGSYTFQTNKDHENQNNVSPMPNHLAKIGLSYQPIPEWQIGIFDQFFSKSRVTGNKTPSYHQLSLNMRYDFNHGIHFAEQYPMTFTLYLDNLVYEKIYFPVMNSSYPYIMGQPGRTIYGEFAIHF